MPNMIYHAIQIMLMLCMEVLRAWTCTKILTVRSVPLYYVVSLSAFVISTTARLLGVPDLIRSSLSIIFISFMMPIALSTDRMSVRFQRMLMVQSVVFLTEIIASTTYTFLTNGSMSPSSIGPHNIALIATVYVETLLIAAPLFQATIAICNRLDGINDTPPQGSIIILMLGTIVMFLLTYQRFMAVNANGIAYAGASLAFCWLAVGTDCLIFASVMRELNARRELTQRAIVARQARHERIEIEAMAQKATSLYRLRHSLASQMRAISNLAEEGHFDQADSRLSAMWEQAHMLAENSGASDAALPSLTSTSPEPPVRTAS